MRLRLLPVFLAAVICSVAAAAAGAKVSAWTGYDLSGTWTNPDPAGGGTGTRLVARQSGTTLRWTGGPNSRAWLQTFEGTVTGSSFSGTFRQDDPAHAGNPRYHGHMEAQILDSCHFEFTRIEQAGQPTLENIEFTRTPCDPKNPAARSIQFNIYLHRYIPNTAREAKSCPAINECVIADGAQVRICNHSDYIVSPFALQIPNVFGGTRAKIRLKPGQCFSKQIFNPGSTPLEFKIYDELHSQIRTILTVLPRRT